MSLILQSLRADNFRDLILHLIRAMETQYNFVTIWQIEAHVQEVWDEIYYSENWPSWWKGVESVVEIEKGDENGVGSLRRYTWKSLLPYKLTFDLRTTRVEKPSVIEGVASGELIGNGIWHFSRKEDITTVRYDWNVRTTKPWMNLLAPIARPFFRWNHDVVMRSGGECLAERLGALLINND